ncbi:MAG: hypothetical protein C0606_12920 [Hyphomicrobiales bacterium]|nr:MAG: hypothetical protein C0606_12920 [Hyphomicrobiales bacterium]
MRFGRGGVFFSALVGMSVLAFGGCSSSGGIRAPDKPTVRASGQTAPADLQLLCASEAATRLGVDSTKVLPVSSGVAEAGIYHVDLNVGDGQARCLIDQNGAVQSVERVEASAEEQPPATPS